MTRSNPLSPARRRFLRHSAIGGAFMLGMSADGALAALTRTAATGDAFVPNAFFCHLTPW